jgi:hypothetical protein
MTKPWLWSVLLAISIGPVFGQVSVEVALPQEQFLQGESLQVAVRITNRSGQTIRLGAEEDWLTFAMEGRDGLIVAKLSDPDVKGEFELESSKIATKRVDLTPYFTLPQPGRYAVSAIVKIKAWDREVSSPPKNFDIIHGAKLWEQEFGLPANPASTNATPEVRKYVLEEANYLKTHLRLYLRVTDASGARPFRVFPIGQMVSFSRPEGQVDKWSDLHVIYANGPHSYSYTVFNPDGDVLVRQTYDYVNSRPRLRANDDGKISVVGGVRRLTAQDIPTKEKEFESK